MIGNKLHTFYHVSKFDNKHSIEKSIYCCTSEKNIQFCNKLDLIDNIEINEQRISKSVDDKFV